MEASEAGTRNLLRAPLRKKQISIVLESLKNSNGVFKPTESKWITGKEGLQKARLRKAEAHWEAQNFLL